MEEESKEIFKITRRKNLWSKAEDEQLLNIINYQKSTNTRIKWKEISTNFKNRDYKQCYNRYRHINPNLKRGPWTTEEEERLRELIKTHGNRWAVIAKALQTRSGKQIRHHYVNTLSDENSQRKKFSKEEDQLLRELYLKIGPKWKSISKSFDGRSADNLKTRFYNKRSYYLNKEINGRSNNNLEKHDEVSENSIGVNQKSINPCNPITNTINETLISSPSTSSPSKVFQCKEMNCKFKINFDNKSDRESENPFSNISKVKELY